MSAEKMIDNDQLVAYDAKGRPLNLHPEEVGTQPVTVQVVKSVEPGEPIVSDIIELKHQRSQQLYPDLNLSHGEYVISSVKRHPIGLILPLMTGALIFAILLAILVNLKLITESMLINGSKLSYENALPVVVLLMVFTLLIVYAFYYVYTHNRFFLTNESIIQEIQYALFSKNSQTVSLANVEDTSVIQSSILQQIFNYGTIRLSTIGEEHTYVFTYASNPKRYIAKLNNAVEAFKNGHPVDDSI